MLFETGPVRGQRDPAGIGVQHPPRDLRETKIRDLDDLANASTKAYGAKASNLGELRKQIPELVTRAPAPARKRAARG